MELRRLLTLSLLHLLLSAAVNVQLRGRGRGTHVTGRLQSEFPFYHTTEELNFSQSDNITMENHNFQWENPLFQWPFSIAFCMFTRPGANKKFIPLGYRALGHRTRGSPVSPVVALGSSGVAIGGKAFSVFMQSFCKTADGSKGLPETDQLTTVGLAQLTQLPW